MLAELPVEHISTGYGLTEATAMCSITRPGDSPDTISTWNGGTPVDDVEIRIVDDAGDPVAVGTPGELLVRGYNVMSGYYDDPEATAEVIEPDGWLHTGDIAVANDDGYFRIVDRKKDIYIAGGFNVSPAEVEGHLLARRSPRRGRGDRRPRRPSGRGRGRVRGAARRSVDLTRSGDRVRARAHGEL